MESGQGSDETYNNNNGVIQLQWIMPVGPGRGPDLVPWTLDSSWTLVWL